MLIIDSGTLGTGFPLSTFYRDERAHNVYMGGSVPAVPGVGGLQKTGVKRPPLHRPLGWKTAKQDGGFSNQKDRGG